MEPVICVHIISHLSPYGGTANKYLAWIKDSKLKHMFVLYNAYLQDGAETLRFRELGAGVIPLRENKFPSQVIAISRIVGTCGRCCMFGHYFRGAALASSVALLQAHVPFIVPMHSPANLLTGVKRLAYVLSSMRAYKVVYNSNHTARSFGYMGDHRVVYNGCDHGNIPVRQSFAPRDTVRMLGTGSLIETKNYRVIVEMMSLLPERYRLTIIGDGPARDGLRELVGAKGLRDRVEIVGRVKNASNALEHADIFLHPSWEESFGMVVSEALFARVPVVVTNTCATYEIIGRGEYGWVADPHDPSSWARTVSHIVGNPGDAWRKAQTGREWALSNFSGTVFSEQMDRIASEAVGQRLPGDDSPRS